MTNLDLVYQGVRGDDEAEEQTDALFNALYKLRDEHRKLTNDDTTPVKTETLRKLLEAYKKLTA